MNRRALKTGVVLVFLCGAAFVFWATTQPEEAAYDALDQLVARPDVIAAVSNANAEPAHDLKVGDTHWRMEIASGGSGPLIDNLMATALSRQLVLDRLSSDGHIKQIMVMDRRGALVAADRPTHDYNQSDEPKWIRTVGNNRREAVFEGRDKSGHGAINQLSQSITDGQGKIIGAVTLRWCQSDGRCP